MASYAKHHHRGSEPQKEMKGNEMKVSDYIAFFLTEHHIRDCFLVTGGGAMYLNDALGHHPQIRCLYCHHEQAAAMAAEGYSRVNNRIAAVCVTTGPGATNAITGVAGAYMGSIPMLVLSGQARYATTVYASGLPLRTRGVQEFDIIGSVRNMTKYCQLVTDPRQIRFCLEKALYLAQEGRPGPCWLDIPLDVQSAVIEPETLPGYVPAPSVCLPQQHLVALTLQKLAQAKRPLIYIGNGVRLAGAHERMIRLAEAMGIPCISGMGSVDAMPSEHPLYVGRSGSTGSRAGNFALQNCDVLLSIGSRQSFFQTGFNYGEWAPNAFKILNDIDPAELEKDSLNPDLAICCDAGALIDALYEDVKSRNLPDYSPWLRCCADWKNRYRVVLPRHYQGDFANIYAFYQEMTTLLPADRNIVASVGTSRVAGSQAAVIKPGQRFITNPTMAAMGFGLPAAVGVCIGSGKRETVLVTGDGSLQMNLQELQTIVHHQLPIAVFVMNNQGYHSIRMTQNAFFREPLIGVGPESGDLSFPDLSRLVPAYGLPYYRISSNTELKPVLEQVMAAQWPCVCEVMLSTTQPTEPKVASRTLADGSIVSGTLQNMAPFLSDRQLQEEMRLYLDERWQD